MKVGILGGTFDPIHEGHLKVAEIVRRRLKLDHVLFIPARIPPYIIRGKLAVAKHRLKMVRLAVEKYPRFLVSTIEMERRGKSYTIDTLRLLRRIYKKGTQFYFIIGSDNLYKLHSWKQIGDLSRLCRFVVVSRGSFPMRGITARNLQLSPAVFRRVTRHLLPIKPIKISGTTIRKRMRSKMSVRVPAKVAGYIRKYKVDLGSVIKYALNSRNK